MRVTLGVAGGVAAYKAVELVRLLQAEGLDVQVVMTEAAQRFVQPLTFAAISGHPVITSLWDGREKRAEDAAYSIDHIAEAQRTPLLVIAPATADTLARLAQGRADDFLGALHLATRAPVLVAPAMNANMWEHPATRANLRLLRDRGVRVVEPESGYLACGMVGSGRLAALEEIVAAVLRTLAEQTDPPPQDLAGEHVLVTAGGTREAIDPVRYLGNRSSGRMGYALAAAAARRGARVTLISAPTSLPVPEGCQVVPVVSAAEMREAALRALPEATLVCMAAAVSDYRVRQPAEQKLKRDGERVLELVPTEDILRELVARRRPGTVVLGFAAETEDVLRQARQKMLRKGVDAIFANDVSDAALGFDSEQNAGWLLTPEDEVPFAPMPKPQLAEALLDGLRPLLARRQVAS
ncbi:MAG: bifunctional phosphopantothenoylcysteine decarboxylase/phosphopantothenate--cysteine ligase CoaBC [Acidobacteriota bacterium]|nr:bifunctional phosphopantothenoylcysteine decarboxylase/phosphopantothenate--cysteine ligase CoaBC [Acidobacteriota bacterium]